MLLTINNNTSSEIVQKKSKFIANLFYVQTEEDAEKLIKEIRKKYYDAKHHCYAYTIALSNETIINRMSDDGEPNGTAGMPMLNVLQKKRLVNVLIVVTRYFGGILLGTGGLVKAYTDATLSAIEKASFAYEEMGFEAEVILKYSDFEKFQYYTQKNNILITRVNYNENITCIIELTKDKAEEITSLIKNNSLKIQKYNILREKNIKKSIEK